MFAGWAIGGRGGFAWMFAGWAIGGRGGFAWMFAGWAIGGRGGFAWMFAGWATGGRDGAAGADFPLGWVVAAEAVGAGAGAFGTRIWVLHFGQPISTPALSSVA
jgi:hypothetical protein